MINSLKVYFIKSLDDSYLKRSLKSFHNTVPSSSDFEIIIVEEKNQREETLNYILSINERTDFLVVADDIDSVYAHANITAMAFAAGA